MNATTTTTTTSVSLFVPFGNGEPVSACSRMGQNLLALMGSKGSHKTGDGREIFNSGANKYFVIRK